MQRCVMFVPAGESVVKVVKPLSVLEEKARCHHCEIKQTTFFILLTAPLTSAQGPVCLIHHWVKRD